MKGIRVRDLLSVAKESNTTRQIHRTCYTYILGEHTHARPAAHVLCVWKPISRDKSFQVQS